MPLVRGRTEGGVLLDPSAGGILLRHHPAEARPRPHKRLGAFCLWPAGGGRALLLVALLLRLE